MTTYLGPPEVKLGTVTTLERVRMGQLSSFHYKSTINSSLSASHVPSDITLDAKEHNLGKRTIVTHADLELVDCRYLLCGLGDGGVAIYDTSKVQEGRIYKEVASVRNGGRGSHRHKVDCCQWYPADTGLFSTSSHDRNIKIWDPNYMKPVEQFITESQVHYHHMSPTATKHTLLAAATDKGDVMLCDLRTGSSMHHLIGHDGAVHMTQWSPRLQHVVASAGHDCTVRLWDVRAGRANLMIFDGENDDKKDSKTSKSQHSKHRKRMKKIPHAHKSSVISLCYTSDGLWLLTFSSNGELKLWNTSTGKSKALMVSHFATDIKRNVRMAVTHCLYPDLVFIPSVTMIMVCDIQSGKLLNVMDAHFSSVKGVVYNPSSLYLHSFSADQSFITWVPLKLFRGGHSQEEDSPYEEHLFTRVPVAQDTWSSDESGDN